MDEDLRSIYIAPNEMMMMKVTITAMADEGGFVS